METNLSPVIGDTASLQTLLNSASWEVDMLIVPSCEPCEPDATDDSSGVQL